MKTYQTSQATLHFAIAIGLFSPLVSYAASEELPEPHHIAITCTERAGDTSPNILAARRYAAFWNTGDARYAESALAPSFIDQTLPAGRPQGKAGPLHASKNFRAAVPDLQAEIEDMVVADDRVTVHLRFKGHFTGQFGDIKGTGQDINFQAFDLYRVQHGQITDNWHLEDNLTLLQQMGIIKQ